MGAALAHGQKRAHLQGFQLLFVKNGRLDPFPLGSPGHSAGQLAGRFFVGRLVDPIPGQQRGAADRFDMV